MPHKQYLLVGRRLCAGTYYQVVPLQLLFDGLCGYIEALESLGNCAGGPIDSGLVMTPALNRYEFFKKREHVRFFGYQVRFDIFKIG